MLRTASLAAAISLIVAFPAHAQRGAPVTQGSTTADLAVSTARLQTTTADLKLKVDDLQAENARLNGKIETLEFLLSQSREEINRMQGDDQEIGRQLDAIRNHLSEQDHKIARLEADAAQIVLSSSCDTSSQIRPVTDPGSTTVMTSEAASTVTQRAGTESVSANSVTGSESAPRQLTGHTQSAQSRPVPQQTGSLGTIPASALPGDAGPLFAEAKSRLIQFDYAGAEQAFRAFLDKFGDDPQAGEAYYWLGEALYQQQALAESGAVFTEMITNYPDDVRAPDALVKLARSLRQIGEIEKACAALRALPGQYPNASPLTVSLAAVERSRSECDS